MRCLFVSILLCICFVASAQSFEVTLVAKGIKEGTVFHLKTVDKDSLLGKGKLKGNTVSFKGNMPEELLRVLLHQPDMKQYKLFWLEAGKTTITMTSAVLRNASVTGGTVNADQQKLVARTEPIEKRQAQLELLIEKEKNPSKSKTLIAEYEALSEKEAITTRQFIKELPHSIFSAYLLNVYATTWGADSTRMLFNMFSESLQETNYGKKVARYLSLARKVDIDSNFVNITAPDTSNNIKKLSDYKGKWILLEFWASWCGPCREENPNLVKHYQSLAGSPFEIFAVSLDENKNDWLQAIRKDKLPWIHVSQLKGFNDDAALTYGISGIPNNFLIDPSGKIVAKDLRGDDIKKWIPKIKSAILVE